MNISEALAKNNKICRESKQWLTVEKIGDSVSVKNNNGISVLFASDIMADDWVSAQIKFCNSFTYYDDYCKDVSDKDIDDAVQYILKDSRENCWRFVEEKRVMVGKIGKVVFVAKDVWIYGAR